MSFRVLRAFPFCDRSGANLDILPILISRKGVMRSHESGVPAAEVSRERMAASIAGCIGTDNHLAIQA
jgi:hypothetical protein